MDFKVKSGSGLSGEVKLPGDKSISHRSIMLGSIANGDTHISGFLQGEDRLATLNAFKEMDVNIKRNGSNVIIKGVGMHGLGQASIAYQNATIYAKDRLQGRDVTGSKNQDGPADPLIVHPDVRRSLMDQKSFVEGARALILWGSVWIDKAHSQKDAEADGIISLITPVIKGFLTDQGYAMTIQAQQIYGGHGYIEEWGMSQFTRDARIAMIYE